MTSNIAPGSSRSKCLSGKCCNLAIQQEQVSFSKHAMLSCPGGCQWFKQAHSAATSIPTYAWDTLRMSSDEAGMEVKLRVCTSGMLLRSLGLTGFSVTEATEYSHRHSYAPSGCVVVSIVRAGV